MGHGIHRELDGRQLLLIDEGGAFAGGAADYNGVGAAGNLILQNLPQHLKVDAAVLVHGCNDGHTRTCKNRLLHHNKALLLQL